MSGLQFDLHTICESCRGIVCSLDNRCPECKTWSQDKMSAYLKHKVSLAGKRRSRKSSTAVTTSLAVASSASTVSHVRLPPVSDDSVIRDPVLSYLNSLSLSGSLGTNLPSFAAPSPVPDSAPSIKGVTEGDSGPEPHDLGGPTRSSGVGAGVILSSAASIPTVLPNISVPIYTQPRFMQDVRSAVSQPLASPYVPLASSGFDQLWFAGGDTVYVTAASTLSPSSLLFPLPSSSSSPSQVVSLPPLPPSSSSSSSSFAASSFPSSAALPSLMPPPSAPLSSLSGGFPSSSFPLSGFPPSLPPPSAPVVPPSLPLSLLGSLSSTLPFSGFPSLPPSFSAPAPPISSVLPSSLPPSSSSYCAHSSASLFPFSYPPPPPPPPPPGTWEDVTLLL